ncbi:uncharacterized protein LOC116926195 isoform X5 [Daphnia magna]|uniref:uncharacterized protein LOC116926195 isoform X5 n=1 Tax=Daphnia magna TaxID=35525 RepID=UPI001E1BA3A5|nr:uncharacterized protein LOC116926195 isoform X5 [Daphnia magna]
MFMEIKAQKMLTTQTTEYGDVCYLTCAEYSSLWFDHHLVPLIPLSKLACIGFNTIIPFELQLSSSFSAKLPSQQIIQFQPNWIISNYPIFLFTPVQNPPSELRFCFLLSSPSPHRCLPLRFRLWVIAVFVYAFSFASSLSSYRPPSSIQQLNAWA